MAIVFRHGAWTAKGRGGALARLGVGGALARLGVGVALACGACSGPPGAGRRLGDDLGGFRVQASEVANGCGPGVLGSRPSFEFEIDLSRQQAELFWGLEGSSRLDAALRFELLADVSLALPPERGGQLGCSIERTDRIEGQLSPDPNGEITAFTGRLEHAFEAAPGAECSLDARIAAGLPQLPCSMAYALRGERSRAPDMEPRPE